VRAEGGLLVPARPFRPRGEDPPGDLVADTTRMREVLGVSCEVGLRDGIAAVLEESRPAVPGSQA